ncbi:STE/STE11/cdc15 protein kinase [Ephemerocybe angulata]|uniref:STE/STE11/cdc15 protein kinase n=1 Tax=Ephemerocybe angulata TaxID=980116 RepID=A0A8H6ICI4_9AGAR|nr:STE/STE11/cdc15 protein kinase [Tulosesus angulatus]
MRLASMSSPALHLSSQALPSPTSQPAVNASSARPPPSSPTRHRSTKSVPIAIPPSPSSPSLVTPNGYASRESPTPYKSRGAPLSPYDFPAPRPPPPPTSPATPTRTRSPTTNRVRVATTSRGIGSASTSHLPLSSSPSPTPRRPSIDSPRRPAFDSPHRSSGETPRRSSNDAGNRSRESPTLFRADSPPASPVSPRARTPSQRAYSQNRHYNISSGSLLLPPTNPEHRDAIRTATTMLCKEIIKPPPHMMKSEQGIKDWEEVEYRTRSLVRLERIWGRSGQVNGSSAGSPHTVAGEERERRTFCEALRDGFVLVPLRASTVVRPDPKEDGLSKTSNVAKFLAACASYGLSHEELFQRDDLIEATSESLARVAQTIVALIKFVESPAPSRSKYMSGQNKSANTGTRSPYGTLSGVSASTPNLLPSSTSPVSPVRKRWSPPNELPTVRSYSPEEPSAESAKTIRRSNDGHAKAIEDDGDELEVKPMKVPLISKPPPPPKSPLRKQSSRTQDPGGLFSWAKTAASPSPVGSPQQDSKHSRQSMASSVITETTVLSTAPSSLLDTNYGHSGNKYATIRTMTTDMTSEAPSINREDGLSMLQNMSWKESTPPPPPPKFRERRSSELHNVDLSRVAEETDDSMSGGSKEGKESRNMSPTREKPAIHLRKGKWPDDFLDAFESHKPQRSITPSSSSPGLDGGLSRGSPLSISPPRKLAVVGANRSNEEGLSQFPRRPTHRPRHSIDSPTGLLPKESLRDASPDSSTTASSRVMLRRHSTKPVVPRTGSRGPRNDDSPARTSTDSPVPFPRTVSGEQANGLPSASSGSSGGDTAVLEGRPRLRGRFQSDVESSSARGRADSRDDVSARPKRTRFESMVNLGTSSNGANSLDGSSPRSLVVKEDGKTPIHFQLGNCIGRGQFGSVYPGLKEEEVTTLMREVDLVKNLEWVRDEDHLSIVLEYAENGSLAQTLKAFGKLNERLVASYVVKILEGLHYLHTSDVVHCDLKAANILTTKNGNVKLSDFGVSLNLRAMEREIKDAPPPSPDIWSLGCTVVELLTGRPPYSEIANSMSVMTPSARPSAEMLCEHPWLKANWTELKDLRPQDSIPFLRRVSTDLHKTDVVRYLSQMDNSESPVSETFVRGDAGKVSPMGRRTSHSSVRPLPENDISPREHSFVKTTFSKPMMCRVCLLNVKKSAVLCAQCSLISHAKCAINAPPTCDLRAQLLLYAQYAEKGNPGSVYSNPLDLLGESKRPGAMSDVPYVAHSASGRTSTDTPPPPSPAGQAHSDRPQSVMSDSTGVSSLRSAATAAESMSSRHQSQSSSGGRASKAPRFSGNAEASIAESDPNRSSVQLPSELSTPSDYYSSTHQGRHDKAPLNTTLPDARRHKRNAKSSGNCIIQ